MRLIKYLSIMMKLKSGKCSDCPPTAKATSLINGKCQSHYWQGLRNQTSRNYLRKKAEAVTEDPDFPSMRSWYLYQIERTYWTCENCGSPVPHYSMEVKFSAQAHILPKELFPSVRLHPLNKLTLGHFHSCNCHYKWDTHFAADDLEGTMRLALEVALVRFDRFCHLIDPSETKHLPKPFLQRLNSCHNG